MSRHLQYKKHVMAIGASLVLILVIILPAVAEEEPSADLSVAVLSDYIWRGQELSRDSLVIQPSMTVSYKDFSANLWGNLDTDSYAATEDDTKSNWNETDFTLSYGKKFGMLSTELGWIYYGLDSAEDSQEFYLNLGADTMLSPTFTIYKDTASAPHWYFLLGISHAFQLLEATALELAGSVSYLKSDDADEYPEYNYQLVATGDKFDNFHDGVISVSLPISVAKYCTITLLASYVFPLSTDAENDMERRSQTSSDNDFFYGGATLSMAF